MDDHFLILYLLIVLILLATIYIFNTNECIKPEIIIK